MLIPQGSESENRISSSSLLLGFMPTKATATGVPCSFSALVKSFNIKHVTCVSSSD